MEERQSGFDHPRSDDVKGREEGGYEGGFGDRGYGDRGDIGDQGTGQSGHRENPRDESAAPAETGGSGADAAPPARGGYSDQADYGDLPQDS